MDLFGDNLYNLYGSTEVAWATIATPADLRAAPGHRRPAAARHGRAALRRRRQRGRRRARPAASSSATTCRSRATPAAAARTSIDGLLSSGDVGHFDAAGPPVHRRPRRRHDRLGRRERLPGRGRGPARRPRRDRRGGGLRRRRTSSSASASRRSSCCATGSELDEDEVKTLRQVEPRRLQGPARRRVRRRAAAHVDRQGAQAGAPRVPTKPCALRTLGAMPQRTDPSISRAWASRSGEGRRLDLHVASSRSARRPALRGHARARPGAARRLAHDRQRLGAAAALRRPASTARACAASSRPRPASRSTRARSSSPAAGEELVVALRRRGRASSTCGVGARRARAGAAGPASTAGPDCAGLCAECGANLNEDPDHAHERGARPRWAKLSRDPRSTSAGRLRYPSRRPWPSRSRSSRTRARTSAARRTRSPRRRSTRARSATSRAARTACARTAASTPVARSCTCTTTTITTTTTSAAAAVPGSSRSRSTPTAPTPARPRSRAAPRSAAARGRARAAVRAGRARSAPADGVEIVDAPVSIAKARRSRRARCARRPTPRSCRPSQAVADGRAPTRSSPAARPAPRSPPALFHVKRARGVHRPGARGAGAGARRARSCCSTAGANVEVRPEHLVQFAHMGAAFMEAVMGIERPRVALLSNGDGADARAPRTSSPPTPRCAAAPAG